MDSIPMPDDRLLDKLIGCFRYSPFKCRACGAKFYRRSITEELAPAAESAPVPNVGVCQRDAAHTLQRVERIILVAEARRLRRG